LFTFFELKEKLAVQGTVSLAGPKVGPLQVCSSKGRPSTGAFLTQIICHGFEDVWLGLNGVGNSVGWHQVDK